MKQIFSSIIIVITALLTVSCGGDLTVVKSNNATYAVYAVLVKDMLSDSARVDVVILKNGDTTHSVTVSLNNNTLDTNTIGYFKLYGPGHIPIDTVYTLALKDTSSLDINLNIRLADSIAITDAGFRFFTGNAEAVSWTGGSKADGYILATTPPPGASVDTGYTAYVGLLNGAIPAETFEKSLSERIVGMHKIYVAAYNGAPIPSPLIPFDMPKINIPADNVSGTNISGRIAGIVIARPDSIDVSDQ